MSGDLGFISRNDVHMGAGIVVREIACGVLGVDADERAARTVAIKPVGNMSPVAALNGHSPLITREAC
jgi:hypothetical protein